MRKENSTIEHAASEAIIRSALGSSVVSLAQELYKADQIQLGAGLNDAGEALVNTIPILDDICDGKLTPSVESRTGAAKIDSYKHREVEITTRVGTIPTELQKIVRARINDLPIDVVLETQQSIDSMMATIVALGTFTTAKRLEPHVAITAPKTRTGFIALKSVADALNPSKGTVIDSSVLITTIKTLSGLDNLIVEKARSYEYMFAIVCQQATPLAGKRLDELRTNKSSELEGIRAMVAQEKLAVLKRVHVEGGFRRPISEFEVQANAILQNNDLSAEEQLVQNGGHRELEAAKELALTSIARKRACQKLIVRIESDEALREAIAKRRQMTGDQLLIAETRIKALVANNALDARNIIISAQLRKVFNGKKILEEEKAVLAKELGEGFDQTAGLSEEEKAVLNRIPKISRFSLAEEHLKAQLAQNATGSEIIGVLRKQIAGELLDKRASSAIDRAIADLEVPLNQVDDFIEEIASAALPLLLVDKLPMRLPNVQIEGVENQHAALALGIDGIEALTPTHVINLLQKLANSEHTGIATQDREGVKIFMVDQKGKETMQKVGKILADLSNIKDTVLMPETEDEISCLLTMLVDAITTGRPLTLITPICPDWSRDEMGRYDFKSLGGNESFIAKKMFAHGREILKVLVKHNVPFKGILLFADWGLETEINAKDTYGQKLSAEDVQMCFNSTVAATDEHLTALQQDEHTGPLFADFSIVSMKDFLEKRLDIPAVQKRLEAFFTTDRKGKRLLNTLADQSSKINRARLGINREENKVFALRNLVEYSTVGSSVGEHSILVVCESRTTSRSYNLPRQKHENVPVFYVKGKDGEESGVNIL